MHQGAFSAALSNGALVNAFLRLARVFLRLGGGICAVGQVLLILYTGCSNICLNKNSVWLYLLSFHLNGFESLIRATSKQTQIIN